MIFLASPGWPRDQGMSGGGWVSGGVFSLLAGSVDRQGRGAVGPRKVTKVALVTCPAQAMRAPRGVKGNDKVAPRTRPTGRAGAGEVIVVTCKVAFLPIRHHAPRPACRTVPNGAARSVQI
jgi:hypothetical protein